MTVPYTQSLAQETPDDTWNFEFTANSFGPDAVLDLRALNEAYAGEHGFVRRAPDGNGFVRGDGKPIRFWGVNAMNKTLTAQQWKQEARWLAKLGVNMIRYGVSLPSRAPGSAITASNAEEIDKLMQVVAAMKAEGIYTAVIDYTPLTDYYNVDLTNWNLAGYQGSFADKNKRPRHPWGVMFVSARLRDSYKAWLRDAYSRPNPYTGIPLAKDPAVMLNQLVTEDSLLWYTLNSLAHEQLVDLGKQYGVWLKNKYGSLDAARKRWGSAPIGVQKEGLLADDFDSGTVGFYNIWEATRAAHTPGREAAPALRLADQIEFIAFTLRSFYDDMAHFFHDELGSQSMIMCGNWHAADSVTMQDAERWTYLAGDLIAENHFFSGIHAGQDCGWRVAPGNHVAWRTALKPLELDDNPPYMMKRIAGRGAILSSTSWTYPNLYQSEGPFLCAAYGSLAGLDGINWEGFNSQPEYDMQAAVPINPTTAFMCTWNNARPCAASNFPAAALIFRNGYIATGAPVVEEQRPLDSLWRCEMPCISDHETPGAFKATGQHVDPLAFLVGPVLTTYGREDTPCKEADLAHYVDRQAGTVKSNTDEISLNYKVGVCRVNAARAQGAAGFLSQAGEIQLRDLVISCQNSYAAILAAPLDGAELRHSHRMLIQIGTTVRPTGWTTKPATWKEQNPEREVTGEEVVTTGQAPWKIANTHASFKVRNSFLSKCTALNAMGQRRNTVAVSRDGEWLTFVAPPDCIYLLLE